MEEKLKVVITLDTTALKNGVKEAASTLNNFGDEGKSACEQVQEGSDAITTSFTKLQKLITGAAIIKGITNIAKTVANAAVKIGKAVVSNYADFEQVTGGAKLLYGEAFEYIQEQSENAWSTVGRNATDYLEAVNTYAVGLKSSLGGSEQAAAELANKIITAEADVVAALGITQESAENAFAGIMKGNYTMLDNLSIGIKGTKEGMQEVIDKVNEWREAQGLAGDLTIDSYADCEQALVDYIEMQGLAGYAAQEASSTITGSISQLKAAWDNFITGLGDPNADIDELVGNVVSAGETVVSNVMPVINSIIDKWPEIKAAAQPVISEVSGFLSEQLSTALVNAGLDIDDVKEKLQTLQDIGDFTVNAVESVSNLVKCLLEGRDAAKELAEGFEKVKEKSNETTEEASGNWEEFVMTLQAAFTGVGEALVGVWEIITGIVSDDWQRVALGWQTIADSFKTADETFQEAKYGYVEGSKEVVASTDLIIGSNKGFEVNLEEVGATAATYTTEFCGNMTTTSTAALENASVQKGAWAQVSDSYDSLADAVFNATSDTKTSLNDMTTNTTTNKGKVLNAYGAMATSATDTGSLSSTAFGTMNTSSDTNFKAVANTSKAQMAVVKNTVKGEMETCKAATQFSWSLPSLKMPHIKISGSFSINPPSAPSFSISWYAKGGVFDMPTLFGYGDSVGGLGENGAEAVVPLENNTEWLDKIAEKLYGNINNNTPIVLQVDGKTLAQTTISCINSLTRQTGSLGLLM